MRWFGMPLLLLLPAARMIAGEQLSGDTLFVRQPCMVFYRCSPAEYDSLVVRDPFRFDSLLTGFDASVRGVTPFLNKNGLRHVATSASHIACIGQETTWVHRTPFVDLFGAVLLSPVRPHELIKGVVTDVVLIQRVQLWLRRGKTGQP